MIWIEFAMVLAFIVLGSKLGGIGIGYAGGAGVLVLCLGFGLQAGSIPTDVILIIMSVISLICAMQKAGGMDYLVYLAEKCLRSNPKYVSFLSPLVTYILTILAGTGHTAFSVLPVIVEVAKEQKIRPSKPLSIAVVASQIAITASPISAALVFFASLLEPYEISYLQLLSVCLPSSFLAIFVGAFVANLQGQALEDDPIYQQRLAMGLIKKSKASNYVPSSDAKRSVWIFLATIALVVLYAACISPSLGWVQGNVYLNRNEAIMAAMLAGGALICLSTRLSIEQLSSTSTFKSGMSACVCVLGVAWLGDTFVQNHLAQIKAFSGELLSSHSWLLAVVLFFSSMLLYSQAATTKALMPLALSVGVDPAVSVACFCAVSALFILPTYPTLLAAIEMDDTGSTRIGSYVFDHPFFLPGVVTVVSGVLFGFLFSWWVI